MPAFGAPQTPTALATGDKVAVLNDENLADAALSMAVALIGQPTSAVLAIYNNSDAAVALVASPDLVEDHFLPVFNAAGVAVTAAVGDVAMAIVAPGLYYAVAAGGAITAGTVWLAR